MKLISEIFEECVVSRSMVVTDEQKIAIFHRVNREFFSWVKPIVFVETPFLKGLDESIYPKVGLVIENDEYGLGIGSFRITCVEEFEGKTAFRHEPIGDIFKIALEYQGDYQLACDFFLLQTQRDNVQVLGGVGVQQIEIDYMELSELRERIEGHFGILSSVRVDTDDFNLVGRC
jgi:hypothetical protein